MGKKEEYIWGLLRIGLGWIFFWAFIDKLFGLGFNTAADKSWLAGTSPTFGFLKFGATGMLGSVFQGLAGSRLVDWLFMLGLLLIGLALILGIARKLACYSAIVLMLLMWIALVPSEHNPILDEHVLYALVLLGLARINYGSFTIGRWWNNTAIVKKYHWLR